MDRVRIEDTGNGYTVSVNGREVQTNGYEVSRDKDNFSHITLYADSEVVLQESGDIEWVVTPRTMKEAVEIVATAIATKMIGNVEFALELGNRVNEIRGSNGNHSFKHCCCWIAS